MSGRWRFLVEVETESVEKALAVMATRIWHDEEILGADGEPFDYTIELVEENRPEVMWEDE